MHAGLLISALVALAAASSSQQQPPSGQLVPVVEVADAESKTDVSTAPKAKKVKYLGCEPYEVAFWRKDQDRFGGGGIY